jgi:hypothetical protein
MQIRLRSTGQVMFEAEFRSFHARTTGASWDQTTAEILDGLGADPVFEGPQASGGTVYQYSQLDGVEFVDDQWRTKYILGPVFVDTTDLDGNVTTASQHEAAYRSRVDADCSKAVRADRNKRLAECDWTQLSDAPGDKMAWVSYRQALRDVPLQEGFPWAITWPEEP